MPPPIIDLRSDTVTQPTPEMREAMATAVVGDAIYGEDPTVNRLEAMFAARVGKEAAIYVPSGTMANQIAIRLHAAAGSLVVAPRRAHVVVWEAGAAALNAGVQFLLADDENGEMDPSVVDWAIEAAVQHQPEPQLLCLENTHMPASGHPWQIRQMEAVVARARAGGMKVHLDGARLFNAEVATGTPAATYAGLADTVMCCLSKGLCAPVGSVLAGSTDLMARARVERQRLGGGMRQAGVIAAAGIVALEQMIDRLRDDHVRARRLAEAVAERWPDFGNPEQVQTNIVSWRHPDMESVLGHLQSEGIRASTIGPGVLRLVTHHDIDDDGVERAAKAISTAP
ncbi:MAG TPA: GntG family PLP-dependent aldolase [Acidimicrobiales bacterium]|nr:GntG family PLP-dependent aldolase [Acidimicrobiales bacterium]